MNIFYTEYYSFHVIICIFFFINDRINSFFKFNKIKIVY